MKFGYSKGLMTGAAFAGVLLAITAAANGTGPGAVFNLGRTNKVNITSTLTGTNRAPMLTVANSGRGTALSLRVGKGRAPFTVNSNARVAKLNASLLGGVAAAGFVRGGGVMKTAQVIVNSGQSSPLLALPGYGTFTAICSNVVGTQAEIQFKASSDPLHLWANRVYSTSAEASLAEDDLAPASTITFASKALDQLNFTIQDAKSGQLNTHVAAAQVVQMVTGGSCDFAVVANAGP